MSRDLLSPARLRYLHLAHAPVGERAPLPLASFG
jgi:hypothetical protein